MRRSLRVRPAEPARQVRQELRAPRARQALRGPARRRSGAFRSCRRISRRRRSRLRSWGIAWRYSISLVPGRLCEWIDCEPLPARKPLVLIVAYRCSFYGRSAGIALHNLGNRRGVGSKARVVQARCKPIGRAKRLPLGGVRHLSGWFMLRSRKEGPPSPNVGFRTGNPPSPSVGFRTDSPPSPSVRRRFACRRPVSAGFAQKRSRVSPVIYLCPLYDRPVACRDFAVRRHRRPAHSGKAMVSRGCRTWQTILSFPTVSPVSRSASRRAVPARRTPSANAKPSARLMPVSLRLRRRLAVVGLTAS